MIRIFEKEWNTWVANFLQIEKSEEMFENVFVNESDIFGSYLNWKFSGDEEKAEDKLMLVQENLLNEINEEMYHLQSGQLTSLL